MQFVQGQASRNVRQDLIATTPFRGCFQSHFIVFKYNSLDLNRNRMSRGARWQSERLHMKERQKQWRLEGMEEGSRPEHRRKQRRKGDRARKKSNAIQCKFAWYTRVPFQFSCNFWIVWCVHNPFFSSRFDLLLFSLNLLMICSRILFFNYFKKYSSHGSKVTQVYL